MIITKHKIKTPTKQASGSSFESLLKIKDNIDAMNLLIAPHVNETIKQKKVEQAQLKESFIKTKSQTEENVQKIRRLSVAKNMLTTKNEIITNISYIASVYTIDAKTKNMLNTILNRLDDMDYKTLKTQLTKTKHITKQLIETRR